MDFEGIGRVADQHHARRLRRRPGRRCSASTRASRSGTSGITINGFLGGLVAITCSVLLGEPDRGDHHRRASPAWSWCSASTSSSSSGSTTRSARSPVHGVVRHLGHAEPRAVRHRAVRRSRRRPARTPRPPSTACSTAAAATSWWRRSSAASIVIVVRRASSALRADVRASRPPARCASPRRASSRASTSTSTARRRTTRSSPTWGTRRFRPAAAVGGVRLPKDVPSTLSVGD